MIHKATFTNNFCLPVIIETWIKRFQGLSETLNTLVNIGETIDIHSETGEWTIHTYITDCVICNNWRVFGLEPGFDIGKFRDQPCAKGDYSWIYRDGFKISHDIDNGLHFTLSSNK
jgi:hypothetical protein